MIFPLKILDESCNLRFIDFKEFKAKVYSFKYI